MKKTLIAGAGVAALGMAALPFAGVFAADGTLTQTDTVKVTVDSSCSLATSGTIPEGGDSPIYTATITNGSFNNNIAGSTFTVTCNDTAGWMIDAIGAGTATNDVTKMDASTDVDSDDIATADGDPSGAASTWAFKVADKNTETEGEHVTIDGGYGSFKAVPSAQTTVAHGTSTKGVAGIKATYGVGISNTQSAGTYTGRVKYTLVHPYSSSTAGYALTLNDGDTVSSMFGIKVTLPTPEGANFQGWATSNGGEVVYQGGQMITLNQATTLYAVYGS